MHMYLIFTLKVLTSTLGRPLGFETAEEILEEENAHDSLDFQMYYDILERKIFDRIDKSSEETLKLVHPNFEEIHKVSWALYFNAFIKGSDQSNHLPEDFVRKLWTIFNLLADDDENGIPLIPPRTDREEIAVLLRAFTLASGQADCESQICIFEQEEGTMDFLEFKTFFLNTFAPNFRFQLLLSTLETIYEEFIGDILEKVGDYSRVEDIFRHFRHSFCFIFTTAKQRCLFNICLYVLMFSFVRLVQEIIVLSRIIFRVKVILIQRVEIQFHAINSLLLQTNPLTKGNNILPKPTRHATKRIARVREIFKRRKI